MKPKLYQVQFNRRDEIGTRQFTFQMSIKTMQLCINRDGNYQRDIQHTSEFIGQDGPNQTQIKLQYLSQKKAKLKNY